MKKILILLMLTIAFVITGCKTEDIQVNVEPTNKEIINKTKAIQENIEIRGLAIISTGTINAISATLENKSSEKMSFEAVLYFKDEEDRILGKNSVLVENLEAGAKKSISIQIMGSHEELATYELVIIKK